MKGFALTLVAALVIGASSAVKLRKAEQRSSLEENSAKTVEDEPITDISDSDVDKKEKEVHKRGVFHYGSLAAPASAWPKSYAAHYGYGLHLPAVSSFSVTPVAAGHVHSPGTLRYNTGFHYRALSSPTSISSFSPAVLPTLTSFSSAAVPHVHQAAPAATPFVIRPGGAVVQSYSVNYPTAAVKPVHAYASVSHPVHTIPTVHPAVPTIQPIEHVPSVQAVQPAVPVKPLHSFASVAHPVHTVQTVQPVHSFQTVQHVPSLQPIQPPVQPVQSVVQVQHLKPIVNYDQTTQQFPSYFQTFQPPAVPAVPAIPQVPTVPLTPVQPAFPDIPAFPNPPAFPTIPASAAIPAIPTIPNAPAIPAIPTVPAIPQPQFPTNGFFPTNVQPPLAQQPPTFISFNPSVQVPGVVPAAGTSNQNNPDFGSAEASPQIPVQPAPRPEPKPEVELPPVQPQPTQQPWKPVLYQPPTVDSSDANRPSNTLLPPYGNSPAEGYLPPAPASPSHKLQHELTINSQLFDNLSDADIQHIFHQANLAAQRDHNHAHTVHTYRSH